MPENLKPIRWDEISVQAFHDMYKLTGIFTLVEDGVVKGFYAEESVA